MNDLPFSANKPSALKIVLKTLLTIISAILATSIIFIVGIQIGTRNGYNQAIETFNTQFAELESPSPAPINTITPTSPPIPLATNSPAIPKPQQVNWGGPELWDLVNQTRISNGVNTLQVKPEICTIASIRLNELLELGKLDGHEGFSNLTQNREDLKWIFEKYNLFEFLVAGAQTPQEAVDAWSNTLAHKLLLSAGEYVWGCIYAQNGFGVAIAAF